MTPERAKEVAAANGCTFTREGPQAFKIARSEVNYGFITPGALSRVSEEQFIAFYIPDKRD